MGLVGWLVISSICEMLHLTTRRSKAERVRERDKNFVIANSGGKSSKRGTTLTSKTFLPREKILAIFEPKTSLFAFK